jgi:hypothetical protein
VFAARWLGATFDCFIHYTPRLNFIDLHRSSGRPSV